MMGAVLYRVRSDLRHRRWAAVGLAALVLLATVVPLTAAAAARRTDSSLARMRAELEPTHGNVQFEDGEAPEDAIERIAALPGVEAVGEGVSMLARPVGVELPFFASFGRGSYEDVAMRAFDRPRLDAGRMPEAADEAFVSRRVADQLGLAVGDEVEIETFTPDGLWAALEGGSFAYDGPVVTLEMVGIGRSLEELTLGGPDAVAPSFAISDAFLRKWEGELGWFDGVYVFRLEGGVDAVGEFERLVREEFRSNPDVSVYASEQQTQIDQAVDAQTIALALLAAAAAAAAMMATGQAVARFTRAGGSSEEVLGALGLSGRGRVCARVLTALVPVASGALGAVAIAVAVSGWFPTGAAGRVEPDPGPSLDAVVILAGLLMLAFVGAATAARAVRPRSWPAQATGRGATDRLAAAGLPLPLLSGLRAASSRAGVPTRSAMFAAVAGVAGVLAAVVFGASLGRLTDTPARYGWNWDLDVGLGDLLTDEEAFGSAERIVGDDRIDGAFVVRIDSVIIEGREEFAYAYRALVGDLHFTVVEGRPPTQPGEIAFGGTSLAALGVSVGDTVAAEGITGDPVELRVVGQALFPVVENTDPARGVSMSLETFEGLASPGSGFPELYVRAVADTDLVGLATDLEAIGFVATDVSPPVINNLRGVDGVPFALAAFLGVLAVAATSHALLTALRRRRRELAILKTLGFVRRQVATTVVVHALVFGVVGLTIGLPLGYGVGRQAWRAVATSHGFAADVLVPAWVASLVPGGLAVILAVAALPARAAARTPSADLLRAE